MEVLEIITDLHIGGAQRVAANIAKYAPPGYHFTYLVFDEGTGEYEPEIRAYGNDVIHIPSPKKGYPAHLRMLKAQMQARTYDVVHCHNMYSCGIVMQLAKQIGIPGRISHSHTAKDNVLQSSWPRKLYKSVMRQLIWHYSTDYLACGEDAGEELYGKVRFQKKGLVIKNGIDTAAYRYNAETRNQIRTQYRWEDRFLIGHIGHYVTVKNQIYLIRLMPEILRTQPRAMLLLFGDGETHESLAAEICQLGLDDSVRLMGNVSNIPHILSALDVFAFPSLLEGTPLALLEAQASGLPCIISDHVPADACVTDLIQKLSLSDRQAWIASILNASRNTRLDYSSVIREKYEDIHTSMEKIYSTFEKYQ